jgi:hypothetical protein
MPWQAVTRFIRNYVATRDERPTEQRDAHEANSCTLLSDPLWKDPVMQRMFDLSLPPDKANTAVMVAWAYSVAGVERPQLAEQARTTAAYLFNGVLRSVPPFMRVHARIDTTETGLRIVLHVPGLNVEDARLDVSGMSSELVTFGTSEEKNGPQAWAELRLEAVNVA